MQPRPEHRLGGMYARRSLYDQRVLRHSVEKHSAASVAIASAASFLPCLPEKQ
jgi:uncharacterized protein (DUF2062 family)